MGAERFAEKFHSRRDLVKRTEREIARDSSAGGKFSALVLAICQGVLSGVGRAAFGRACESGAMAQQVAHLLCKQGVTGSSPVGSTPSQTRFAPAWWVYFLVRTAESTAIQTPC